MEREGTAEVEEMGSVRVREGTRLWVCLSAGGCEGESEGTGAGVAGAGGAAAAGLAVMSVTTLPSSTANSLSSRSPPIALPLSNHLCASGAGAVDSAVESCALSDEMVEVRGAERVKVRGGLMDLMVRVMASLVGSSASLETTGGSTTAI